MEGTIISTILDVLSEKHRTFISSIKYGLTPEELIHDFKSLQVESYSIEDWNYSLSYIYTQKFGFTSYDEIKTYLNTK